MTSKNINYISTLSYNISQLSLDSTIYCTFVPLEILRTTHILLALNLLKEERHVYYDYLCSSK